MADARVPALAIYHEWLGEDQTPQEHTIKNIETSIRAQQGDVDSIVTTVHIHQDKGAWVIATAPLRNLVNLPMMGMVS